MDSDYDVCPLCTDPLDATDKAINYCQCGYKMCLWCWNQLMETAGKENLPGKCPNCRTEYDKDKITMAQLDPEELHKEQQKKKEQVKKKAPAAGLGPRPPRNLGQVRVVQRNLVYAVGMPLGLCREEVLADRNHFGAFGRIKKVSVNRSTPVNAAAAKNGPSGSAYVTYFRPEDALRCIEAVDGAVWEGKTIKACFGTTKYCNAFLKGVPCNNHDCLYLHDIAEACDSFSKEDMVANGLASGRSSFYDLVHPTHSREATEQAHAAIGSSGSAVPGTAAAAATAAGTGVPPPGAAVGAVAAATGAAGVTPQRQATQPMTITGVRRPSQPNSPWGSVPGEGLPLSPAPAAVPVPPPPPHATSASAAAAAAAAPPGLSNAGSLGVGGGGLHWAAAAGRSAAAAPPPPVATNLADMEWPSLGGASSTDGPLESATSSGGGSRTPGARQQQPGAGADGGVGSRAVTANGPTAAAVVAGAAAVSAAKQQQQPQEQKRTLATLTKPGKAAKSGNKQPDAPAAAAAAAAGAAAGKGPAAAAAGPASATAAAAAPAAGAGAGREEAADGAAAVAAPAAAANGKPTKAEAKKAAKAAAKQAEQERKQQEQERKLQQQQQKKLEQEQKALAKQQAKEQKALEKQQKQQEKQQQDAAAKQQQQSSKQAAQQQQQQQPEQQQQQQLAAAEPAPTGSKPPPPGFVGAPAKGPPPGFAGARVPPGGSHPAAAAGLQPSLIALARAASNPALNRSNSPALPPGFGAATAAAPDRPAAAGPGPSSSAVGMAAAGASSSSKPHANGPAGVSGPNSNSSGFDVNSFFDTTAGQSPYAAAAGPGTAPAGVGGLPGGSLFGPYGGGAAAVDGLSAAPAAGPVDAGGQAAGRLHGGSSDGGAAQAAASPAAGTGFSLSTLKQSRWSFAQQDTQPQQQQPQQHTVSQLLGTLPPLNTQRQSDSYSLTPPPGFPGVVPAPGPPPGHQGFAGGFGGWGSSTVAQATSFFKHLLPGVNVTVAAGAGAAGVAPGSGGEYGAAAAANGPAAANGNRGGFPAFMGGPPPAAAGAPGAGQQPNPGAALLQQLQRGQQQQLS